MSQPTDMQRACLEYVRDESPTTGELRTAFSLIAIWPCRMQGWIDRADDDTWSLTASGATAVES